MPQFRLDVVGDHNGHARGLLQRCRKPVATAGASPVALPYHDHGVDAPVADAAGLDQLAQDAGETAGHRLGRQRPFQLRRRLHSVLERNHHRVPAHQRPECPAGRLDLPGLGRHQHRVRFPERRGVIGGGDTVQAHVPRDALDPQTARPQRRQLWSARDEDDFLFRLDQASSEVAADGSGPMDHDSHGQLPETGPKTPRAARRHRHGGRRRSRLRHERPHRPTRPFARRDNYL